MRSPGAPHPPARDISNTGCRARKSRAIGQSLLRREKAKRIRLRPKSPRRTTIPSPRSHVSRCAAERSCGRKVDYSHYPTNLIPFLPASTILLNVVRGGLHGPLRPAMCKSSSSIIRGAAIPAPTPLTTSLPAGLPPSPCPSRCFSTRVLASPAIMRTHSRSYPNCLMSGNPGCFEALGK